MSDLRNFAVPLICIGAPGNTFIADHIRPHGVEKRVRKGRFCAFSDEEMVGIQWFAASRAEKKPSGKDGSVCSGNILLEKL